MKTHVPMDPAWFEPGPDGVSPFERLSKTKGFGAAGTAAAFRALLAGDEATEPPALQVGDVVRLEEFRQEFTEYSARLSCKEVVGKEAEVTFIGKDSVTVKVPGHWCSNVWSPDALTLIRRAGEAAPVDADAKDAEIAELRESLERSRLALNTTRQQRDQFWSQRDAARAEVERLQGELRQCKDERMAAEIERDAAEIERDALRARIDAGVRAWEKWKQQCGSLWLWAFPGATASQAWSDVCDALDADYVVYPIDQPVDERTAGSIADRGKAS